MGKQHRQYSAAFKFKVALEAAKGSKTLSELASEMEVHPHSSCYDRAVRNAFRNV